MNVATQDLPELMELTVLMDRRVYPDLMVATVLTEKKELLENLEAPVYREIRPV